MSIELHALRRIALTEEADGAFATDVTGSATYLDLPFQEGTANLTLNLPELDAQVAQQRIDARNQIVFGPKSAELSVTVPLGATGVAAGDGSDSPAFDDQALLLLLKIVFGGANDENTGGDVTSAAASYQLIGSPAGWDGGESIGWVNSAGVFEARSVRGLAATTIQLKDQLSATPTASDVLYAGTTIHPTANPLTSIQMIVEGAEQDDRWLLMGGQVTSAPAITVALGEIPTISFTITFANWASEPSAAITVADYGTFTPVAYTGSLRAINGVASGSISGVCLDAATINLAMNSPVYTPVRSGCGTNTIKRYRRNRAVPFCTLTAHIPYEDTSWFTERDDGEYYGLTIQIGTVAGFVVLLEVPKAQVTNVQLIDEGGLAYQAVTFSATTDSFTTQADDADIQYAAFRLHFL
tara:strand:+ start:652 stop:1887 length:1236 start_codon:yes stop_codon:yes gene_type:complete